ncbi:MAG: IS200/IS605 family transposase [Planctomycetes bacterium]|nr:IS200/IS605 family transposase [Planctomycetota bacterium]
MHTYTNLLTHVAFSTKERSRLINDGLRPRLLAYMGGIVRELGGRALAIDGSEDHVHLLLLLPPSLALSDAMRTLKTNASRWVHETFPDCAAFAWQEEYAAFSVSESNRDAVKTYITNQQDHHRRMDFKEELIALLRKHGIDYDEAHLWD